MSNSLLDSESTFTCNLSVNDLNFGQSSNSIYVRPNLDSNSFTISSHHLSTEMSSTINTTVDTIESSVNSTVNTSLNKSGRRAKVNRSKFHDLPLFLDDIEVVYTLAVFCKSFSSIS